MEKKFKIAHLAGITREHEKQFREAEKLLTRQGYIVFSPVFYNLDEYNSFGKFPNMLDDMCYEKLSVYSDFLVIVTPEHIGKSTSLRIRQAREMNKPVYVIKDGELVPFEMEKLRLHPGDIRAKIIICDGVIDSVLFSKEAVQMGLAIDIVDYDSETDSGEALRKEYEEPGMIQMGDTFTRHSGEHNGGKKDEL